MRHQDFGGDVAEMIRAVGAIPVTDICVLSYRDDDREGALVPWFNSVYLELASGDYLRIEALKYEGLLRLGLVSSVDEPPELKEEDFEFVIASFAALYMGHLVAPQRITALRWVTDPASLKLHCMELRFANDSVVFFDPEWPLGMKLGDRHAYGQWINDHEEIMLCQHESETQLG